MSNKTKNTADKGGKKSAVKLIADYTFELQEPVLDDNGEEITHLRGTETLRGFHARKYGHLKTEIEVVRALARVRFGISDGVLDRLTMLDHNKAMRHINEITDPTMGK